MRSRWDIFRFSFIYSPTSKVRISSSSLKFLNHSTCFRAQANTNSSSSSFFCLLVCLVYLVLFIIETLQSWYMWFVSNTLKEEGTKKKYLYLQIILRSMYWRNIIFVELPQKFIHLKTLALLCLYIMCIVHICVFRDKARYMKCMNNTYNAHKKSKWE